MMKGSWGLRTVHANVLIVVMIFATFVTPAPSSAQTGANDVPVLAYYYIWFTPDSWNRAKLDIPLLGPYASDDEIVIRQHVQWAKESGIDGFIVSWKNTEQLSPRLATLVKVANEEDFKLAVIYEALDFWRHPLPEDRIDQDLAWFTENYADNPAFDLFGKPVVIWSGTWEYDRTEIEKVTEKHRGQLQILASQKQPEGYTRIADLVDGNAYYWSSVNPDTFPDYPGKLQKMADAVHQFGGLWIAPAAPGFDARHLGGSNEVLRNDGKTLEEEFGTAMGSHPDAIGLISWNEFSENSHIEPSCLHKDRYLEVVANLLGGRSSPVTLRCNEDALATAVAGAVVPDSEASPTADAGPAVASNFDWDSSAPGGAADRGARIGIIVLLGAMAGLMGISILKIGKRAVLEEHEEHKPATPPASTNFKTHQVAERHMP